MTHNNYLNDKYTILTSIGKGAFGEVYKAIRIYDNLSVAMKIEKKTAPITRLIQEYKIYQNLVIKKCQNGIPKVYECIQTDDYNIIVMELLGQSLEDVFNNSGRKFSISTILFLGINILKIIEKVHKAGYIHRDIKPNNFLIGYNNKQKIYLTDFGLSKKYMTSENAHIPETFNHSVIGTARYSSINMHMGFEPSRRDDLESIGYMLIYFTNGHLPWQGVCRDKNKESIFECIGNIKLSTKLETLCKHVPKCFISYLQYCRNLEFDENPNYNFLIKLFSDTIKENNYNCIYEWM